MVAPSFLFALGFRLSLTRSGSERESGAGPHPRVARGVVVGVAVAVDITEVGSVARIRRTLPPVVSRQGNNAGLDPVIREDFYIGRDLSA